MALVLTPTRIAGLPEPWEQLKREVNNGIAHTPHCFPLQVIEFWDFVDSKVAINRQGSFRRFGTNGVTNPTGRALALFVDTLLVQFQRYPRYR